MTPSGMLRFGLSTQPQNTKRARRPWRPPKAEEGKTWIRLIDGKYKIKGVECQGFSYAMHYIGQPSGRGFYIAHTEKDCVPCYLRDTGQGQNISLSVKILMTAFAPGWFHLVEKQSTYNNGTFKMKELCKGPDQYCPYCSDSNPEVRAKTYGRRLGWSMTATDAEILRNHSTTVSKTCGTCGGNITTLAIACENCRHIMYDMKEVYLDDNRVLEEISNKRSCPSCHKMDYPKELLKCSRETCTLAKRATLFDVNIEVSTIRTGNRNFPQLAISRTSEPEKLEDIIARDGATNKVPDYMFEPVDPADYIIQESPRVQAARLKVDNPFAGSEQSEPEAHHSRPYGY